MASVMTTESSSNGGVSKRVAKYTEDEEEELFEIDFEAVGSIPPPHYWDSCFTSTGTALLANCLLPIADVSSAVPMTSTTCRALSLAEQLMFFGLHNPPLQPFQEALRYSSS